MDDSIFKKLKVKPGMTGSVFFVPPEYPPNHGLEDAKGDAADFVHLFVTSRAEFADRFAAAADTAAIDGFFGFLIQNRPLRQNLTLTAIACGTWR